ncbi:Asp-tRNA(Asn)/Glu-tRNA(Gln) amidotransferase subunit GatC [Pseudodesulfovibrio sp. JC047]|uniref:Asp-tRNA(Asn)/Glu-tRNA(Gln) amidotransferase subunit GatC n=1 Tax=Pseudodesulfovibrio sp. JC047 TaxID=2683199 RepID=UPI0013D5852A|nr:Asp-tRNA(Asn)/Glu-tRNA(Gln) amidotransferase subunit GatC [Pseudodesulfovibrio sp. JC047]NDV18009.1 Asp-tRNA(Asn)/Glu-tRNA(Gln) amidotransferase subunit GatC [Pseudodesulfovibrio sp. JC047]
MKISPEEVAKVARLSRLDLPQDKLELFAGQLGDILSYMDKLGELETDAVDPLYSPVSHTTVLRKDAVSKESTRDEVLSNAPEQDGKFFIVPRIV